MAERPYPIVIVPLTEEDGGGYAAYAPDLHGCMSDGETPEEAVANVKGAIEEWLAEMDRLGRPVPKPGSVANAIDTERRELISLIQKQGRLLKRQDKASGGLQEKVEELNTRVAAFLETETGLERTASAMWGGRPAFLTRAGGRARRSGHGDQPH